MKCQKCPRPATRLVRYLSKWRPMCRYHVGAYYDLPQRSMVATRYDLRQLNVEDLAR